MEKTEEQRIPVLLNYAEFCAMLTGLENTIEYAKIELHDGDHEDHEDHDHEENVFHSSTIETRIGPPSTLWRKR